jgi:hypothetical protein
MQEIIESVHHILNNYRNGIQKKHQVSKKIHTTNGSGEAVETQTKVDAQGKGTQCTTKKTIQDGEVVNTKESCKSIKGSRSAQNKQTGTQDHFGLR